MRKIMEIADEHDLVVIEDAACALGSYIWDEPILETISMIGIWADLTCFSFHPRKIITTGEGGMITTDNMEYAKLLEQLRSHGMSLSDRARHDKMGKAYETYDVLGYNYRMTDIQAAIGCKQMKRLDRLIGLRRKFAQLYTEQLLDIADVEAPYEPDGYFHTYQSYVVHLTPTIDRDAVVSDLGDYGIACRRGTPAIHEQRYCKDLLASVPTLKLTENRARSTIFLPLYPQMTESDVKGVVRTLKHVLDGVKRVS
jgi:perosamine synthetase